MTGLNEIQNKLKLALVQFSPLWENAAENRLILTELFSEIPKDCDIIILPEAFNTGFSMNAVAVAEPMDGATIKWMQQVSVNKSCAVCGSLFIQENGNFFNRFCWVQPNGEVLTYDKRHLFSMGNETNVYSNGHNQLLIEYKGWKIFPQICYDLRFPVWSRNTSGYHLLINSANWPSARKEVWNTLLKARAIENQCYVVAINRIGEDGNGISYAGNTMSINYKGEVVNDAKDVASVLLVEFEMDSLLKFRKKFDTLKDADLFNLLS